jgi:phosphate transport system substrate-binding protein
VSAANAYPLSTFSYAIVPDDSAKADLLRPFLLYAIGPGQRFGAPLQFAALPHKIVAADKQTIARIKS